MRSGPATTLLLITMLAGCIDTSYDGQTNWYQWWDQTCGDWAPWHQDGRVDFSDTDMVEAHYTDQGVDVVDIRYAPPAPDPGGDDIAGLTVCFDATPLWMQVEGRLPGAVADQDDAWGVDSSKGGSWVLDDSGPPETTGSEQGSEQGPKQSPKQEADPDEQTGSGTWYQNDGAFCEEEVWDQGQDPASEGWKRGARIRSYYEALGTKIDDVVAETPDQLYDPAVECDNWDGWRYWVLPAQGVTMPAADGWEASDGEPDGGTWYTQQGEQCEQKPWDVQYGQAGEESWEREHRIRSHYEDHGIDVNTVVAQEPDPDTGYASVCGGWDGWTYWIRVPDGFQQAASDGWERHAPGPGEDGRAWPG